jgi:hypothetical protein
MTKSTSSNKGFSGYKCVEKESRWVKYPMVSGGSNMIAWLDPWTGESQWNCPEPAPRKYKVCESVAEVADWVKPCMPHTLSEIVVCKSK